MENIFEIQHKTPKGRRPFLRAHVNHDGMMELREAAKRINQIDRNSIDVALELSKTQRPGAQGLSQDARWFLVRGALLETSEGVEQFMDGLAVVQAEIGWADSAD